MGTMSLSKISGTVAQSARLSLVAIPQTYGKIMIRRWAIRRVGAAMPKLSIFSQISISSCAPLRLQSIATSSEAMQTPKVTMYFDGGCPVCSREVSLYRRLDATR